MWQFPVSWGMSLCWRMGVWSELYTWRLFLTQRCIYKPETSTFQPWASSHSCSWSYELEKPIYYISGMRADCKKAELIYFSCVEYSSMGFCGSLQKLSLQVFRLCLTEVIIPAQRWFFPLQRQIRPVSLFPGLGHGNSLSWFPRKPHETHWLKKSATASFLCPQTAQILQLNPTHQAYPSNFLDVNTVSLKHGLLTLTLAFAIVCLPVT